VSPYSVRLAADDDEMAAVYSIRYTVFVEEQGVPVDLERDERDEGADHFVAEMDGRPSGAARMVVEAPGFEGTDASLGPAAHLGRLAVLPEARGDGLGLALVRAVEARAVERGLRLIYLGAQTHALGFYERLGYEKFGEEFDDAGLAHRHMSRRL
jgi:predicted GNAT family N-acyltransferase